MLLGCVNGTRKYLKHAIREACMDGSEAYQQNFRPNT